MGGSTLMDEKEYIVTLKKGVEYDQFNQEMIASTGAGDILYIMVSLEILQDKHCQKY